MQETLLAAWQGLAGFEERASLRTWLYRIATNRCLNWLRSASRRPPMDMLANLPVESPEPARLGEVTWLEPFPDVLPDGLPDPDSGPEARYEAKEAISLAFITALQLLPPRQRAALILRDVLGFRAAEAAEVLGTTAEAVTSALKRARATLASQEPKAGDAPAPAQSEAGLVLSARFVSAFESGDVEAIVALLTEDAWLRMPPVPFEYQGREVAGRFFTTMAFRDNRRLRLIPTQTNGQPAFGVYLRDPATRTAHAHGLFVITIRGGKISAITAFSGTSLVSQCGLPQILEARSSSRSRTSSADLW